MRLSIRTLDQKVFQIDVEPTYTIHQVKAKIQAEKGHDVVAQKLIFAGKMLSDTHTVEGCGVKETDFLVMMVTAKKSAPAPIPAAVSESVPVAVVPSPTVPSEITGPVQTQSENQAVISHLSGMGFSMEEATRALDAVQGNADRAIELLISGGVAEPTAQSTATSTSTNTVTTPSEPVAAGTAPATAELVGEAAQSPSAGPFAHLADHDNFLQMRMLLQQQPQLLRPFLEEMGRQCPDFIRMVSSNQEAFLAALNNSEFPRPVGPPGSVGLQLTPEEKDAIER
eukprot:Ihof_evm21s10 gene=Ihof_evmTU21s10